MFITAIWLHNFKNVFKWHFVLLKIKIKKWEKHKHFYTSFPYITKNGKKTKQNPMYGFMGKKTQQFE